MKELLVSLKPKLFKMTKSGESTEMYLEVNEYWFRKLVKNYRRLYYFVLGERWMDDKYKILTINFIIRHMRPHIVFREFSDNVIVLDSKTKYNKQKAIWTKHAGIDMKIDEHRQMGVINKPYFVVKHGEVRP